MNERNANPSALNVALFCQEGEHLAGHWPLQSLARLHDGLLESPDAGPAVQWSADGSLLAVPGGQPEVWLHLQAAVAVTLQCQRCLESMTEALTVDRRLRFVRSEAEAERLDEVSEDDVLVLEPRLDLQALLEDELILALPLVPRHAGECPVPLPLPADELPPEEPAPNPFAALAALRKSRQGQEKG